MTDTTRSRPSLKEFDAYADRNGQDLGTDSPLDVGIPARTQADLRSNPDGQAEAETPKENLRRISDPSTTPAEPDAQAQEAIERATAAVGQEEAPRHGK
ncbi:MAG: hypothetical protein PGN25_17825 [Methylorubrum populi]